MARTGPKKITAFIVETDWPGVEVVQRLHFMGLKAIENGIIRFTDVKVPVENVLWGEGKGLKLALITLNTGRLTLPASARGGRQAGARDRAPVGGGAGAVGPADRQARRDRPEDRAHGGGDLRHGGGGRSGLAAWPTGARTDIRLEAAMAKMWNTEVGWRIVDDTLQIKGGRGYETADSLRSRGERPDPVERMMRDFRINLIFEGSSEIMRLFIAREAVDTHLKVAGDLIDPKAPIGRRSSRRCSRSGAVLRDLVSRALVRPAGRWLGYGEFGPLATHMRFVDRASRKLARTLFHCMVRFGPKLEKRQAVLGRLVEIGAELLAISAACSRAQAMVTQGSGEPRAGRAGRRLQPAGPPPGRGPRSPRVFDNDDVATYAVAQQVLRASTPGWSRGWRG